MLPHLLVINILIMLTHFNVVLLVSAEKKRVQNNTSFLNPSPPLSQQPIPKSLNVTGQPPLSFLNPPPPIARPAPGIINLGGKSPAAGDCFKKFPQLKQRFSFEQLEYFCQQWRSYNEIIFANNSNETKVPQPFSAQQQAYLNSLKVNINSTENQFPKAVRKEYRAMSESERHLFISVIKTLKEQKVDNISKYDLIVMLRHPALAPGAQVGAAFMPWHREYLRTFERALQQVNAHVSLPYWDTSVDEALPDPITSVFWTEMFAGNGDGHVQTGPFANWSFEGNPANQEPLPLTRNISQNGKLMSETDANFLRSRKSYSEYTACVDLKFEQMIRGVHEWVGGSMATIYYSPQDPLFFMFHAFIDSIWDDWRRSQSYNDRRYGYPSNKDACTKYHYANSPMSPFEPMRNIDGLSDVYTDVFYSYQVRPTCNPSRPVCLSTYMTCDVKHSHCLSQIQVGGNCTGVEQYKPCHMSDCVAGSCVEKTAHNNSKKPDKEIPVKQTVALLNL